MASRYDWPLLLNATVEAAVVTHYEVHDGNSISKTDLIELTYACDIAAHYVARKEAEVDPICHR